MKISLIISTYNWTEALELSLISVLNQKVMPYEVIIADDGSTTETKELIDLFREKFRIPLIHEWHEDRGFLLAEIRNRAIKRSSGDFICQIDGDIILHPYFISDYLKVVKPNFYYRGSRVKMSKELSSSLFKTKNVKINFFAKGIENRFNSFRNSLLNIIMDQPREESKNALGCNMGFWREDLIKINGYSNDLTGWGHEDEELCARLVNLGVFKRRIKHKAIAYHIYHKERNPDLGDAHFDIIDKIRNDKTIITKNGIKELK